MIVCGIPRCGSSLLTSLLESAGAGHPREYFWRDDISAFKERWGVQSARDYVDAVRQAGTSANGVFALKLMWVHLNDLFLYARAVSGDYESGDLDVLAAVFSSPRFVWIRRDDVIGQAVSWWKAIQSGHWWAGQEATSEPEYGFEQIDWLVNEIRVHDGCGRRWFDAEGIEPIIVDYAALCGDQEGVTRSLLAALGIEPVPGTRIAPAAGLARQADEISAEWAARYEAERQQVPG